jgi:hypothetical protein
MNYDKNNETSIAENIIPAKKEMIVGKGRDD